jgi:hypothetical protein
MAISRRFLLKIRNVSNKSYTENEITHFKFVDSFPKIVAFMRKCRKIWTAREKTESMALVRGILDE